MVYRSIVFICVLAIGSSVSIRKAQAGNGASAPVHGIFAINAVHLQTHHGVSSYQVDSSMLTNPSVDGISIRMFWTDVEPTEGVFGWSTLDSLIAQTASAGKVVSIRIMPGYSTPDWVYAAGAQAFNFVWDQSTWGPAFCSIARIPVPWDPVFLSKWNALVQAFGAHYSNNAAVVAVKITGLSTESEETNLPFSVNKPLTNGQIGCTSNNDVANWQAIGYTRTRAVNAWEQIAQMFQQAFPGMLLEDSIQPGGFPPIDNNGNLISGFNGADTIASQNITNYAVSTFGTQFGFQNDALTSTWNWSYQAGFASRVETGYQTLAALGLNLPAALNNVINSGADYVELYEGDLTNPVLQPALALIHNILG
jgi:hypothetical protein